MEYLSAKDIASLIPVGGDIRSWYFGSTLTRRATGSCSHRDGDGDAQADVEVGQLLAHGVGRRVEGRPP